MRKSFLLLVLVLMLFSGAMIAQESRFGLGIILGEPTGLNAKNWLSEHTAVVGAIAWSFHRETAVHLHADYLIHNFNLLRAEKGKLALYYGIGGRIKFEEESKFGARIPLGINYLFEKSPLDFFLEVVPLLELIPGTEFKLNAAIGMRYFF